MIDFMVRFNLFCKACGWNKSRQKRSENHREKRRWKTCNVFDFIGLYENDTRREEKSGSGMCFSFHRDCSWLKRDLLKSRTKRIRWIASLKHQMKPKLKMKPFFCCLNCDTFETKRLKASLKNEKATSVTLLVTQIASYLCICTHWWAIANETNQKFLC